MKLWTKRVQTLMECGLSRCQAKVYLALVRLSEDSKASRISKFANVARQDVYRILNELQQLGLVEKVIAQPYLFRAIPLHEAASILLQRKIKLCSELSEKVKEIADNSFGKAAFSEESERFALVTEMEAIKLKTKEAIENSKEEILYLSPYKEMSQWLVCLNESFVGSIKRGVRIRWVTDTPKDYTEWSRIVKNFVENPGFNLRFVQSLPKAKFGLYDRKEIIMALFVDYDIGEASALQSGNGSFVSIAEEYFETVWKTGIDVTSDSFESEKSSKLYALGAM